MHRHFRHSSQQRSPNNSSPGPVPPIQSVSPCQPNLRRRLDRLVFCDPRRPTTTTPRAERAKRPRDDRRRLSATDRPRAAFPRPFHLLDTPPRHRLHDGLEEKGSSQGLRCLPDGRLET